MVRNGQIWRYKCIHVCIYTHIFCRRKWQPAPVLLPEKFHGWEGLVGYRLWGCKESDTTKQHTHTHTHTHTLISPYSYYKILSILVLCIIFLWLIYFITGSLYLLMPFTYLVSFPTPSLLETTSLFSGSMSLFVFYLFCFLDSIYKWRPTVFVFLCLTYFTKNTTLQIYPWCHKYQDFIVFMAE